MTKPLKPIEYAFAKADKLRFDGDRVLAGNKPFYLGEIRDSLGIDLNAGWDKTLEKLSLAKKYCEGKFREYHQRRN